MKNILFVGAHNDDLEITSGGTINRLIKHKYNVFTCVCCGNNRDNIFDTTRINESMQGLKRLGVNPDNMVFLNCVDTKLVESRNIAINLIEDIINKHNIDTVFTHFQFDTHQDHSECFTIVSAAARNVSNIIMTSPTFPSGRTIIQHQPNLIIRLKESNINAKIEALKCHKSQIDKYGSELWFRSISSIAEGESWKYGGRHGYCETFQLVRGLL